ncbi:hypothetical protein [Burkholderia cepacia]|uniref:hypothetical protein n=1 Tax=Burkholderia cepacia TaxID=292 RepID=UPI002AB74DE8|nr:hypothetical protein [Burkholderia cepacia]
MPTTKKSRNDALTRESIEAIARKYAGAYFSGLLFQDADSFARFSGDLILAASPVAAAPIAQWQARQRAEYAGAELRWLNIDPHEVADLTTREDMEVRALTLASQPTPSPAGAVSFDEWARREGLISESHGVRFVNSMCDVARKAWDAARSPAMAAEAVASPAAAILLAEPHTGLRVDYSGLLKQARHALKRGMQDTGSAEMLRQLQNHLTELGQRWYAGDTAVVDELLQLYCVEKDARDALAATPQPAQADARIGLTDEQRSDIHAAIRAITDYTEEIKASYVTVSGTWCDPSEEQVYQSYVALLERLRAHLQGANHA